jgi:hypothetical protein
VGDISIKFKRSFIIMSNPEVQMIELNAQSQSQPNVFARAFGALAAVGLVAGLAVSADRGGDAEAAAWHPINQDAKVFCVNDGTPDWMLVGTAQSSESHDRRMNFVNAYATEPVIGSIAISNATNDENSTAKMSARFSGKTEKAAIGADVRYPGAPEEAGPEDKVYFEGGKPKDGCEPEATTTTKAETTTTIRVVSTPPSLPPIEVTTTVKKETPTTTTPATSTSTTVAQTTTTVEETAPPTLAKAG